MSRMQSGMAAATFQQWQSLIEVGAHLHVIEMKIMKRHRYLMLAQSFDAVVLWTVRAQRVRAKIQRVHYRQARDAFVEWASATSRELEERMRQEERQEERRPRQA